MPPFGALYTTQRAGFGAAAFTGSPAPWAACLPLDFPNDLPADFLVATAVGSAICFPCIACQST
ncbi:hypothetical protein GCM10007856_40410 [Azospirillum oryzae]|nr:hypothetical protein GCM10007856_40410 [Azospirillum oryzae]